MDHSISSTQAEAIETARAGSEPATPISLVYFASVRETVGVSSETLEIPKRVTTIAELVEWLRARGPTYEAALNDALSIRAAVDRVHATPDTSIESAREIAIFPMMTGG